VRSEAGASERVFKKTSCESILSDIWLRIFYLLKISGLHRPQNLNPKQERTAWRPGAVRTEGAGEDKGLSTLRAMFLNQAEC
jgi:hypothetical protein